MEPVDDLKYNASLSQCEYEEQGSATVETIENTAARLGRLLADSKKALHELELEHELEHKGDIYSSSEDTTNRDTGGNLIARRAPDVVRDGWQPNRPACPKCRQGSVGNIGHSSVLASDSALLLPTPCELLCSEKTTTLNNTSVYASPPTTPEPSGSANIMCNNGNGPGLRSCENTLATRRNRKKNKGRRPRDKLD